ncbi:MAG TPA: DUF92 domain-containing protein [Gemmatimonadales bacterium]|nr:DUF92 domain-containing protein [Gemmatimonadales bacterium]
MRLTLAAEIAVAVALLATGFGALSGWGCVAAAAVGTVVLWAGGWAGAAALFAFFLSSSALSHLLPDPAARQGEAKGGRRDAGQVLANGGAAAIAALAASTRPTLALWAITSSLAVAAADTWATAIGATSPRPPHHILSGATIPAGTSGGVTLRGTFGALLGALVVAAAAAVVTRSARLFMVAAVVGWVGMVLDSALGGTVQGRFHCPACDVDTERAIHRCGTPALPTHGWHWLTNDGVNAIATGSGAVLGAAAWYWIGRGAR